MPASTRALLTNPNGARGNLKVIIEHLVKSKAEISPGVGRPTSHQGGKNAITGPATVADAAVAKFLKVSYRQVVNRRSAGTFDFLRVPEAHPTKRIPGANDRPYSVIAETLQEVFGVGAADTLRCIHVLGGLPESMGLDPAPVTLAEIADQVPPDLKKLPIPKWALVKN